MERGLGPLERNSTWLRRPPGRKKEENSIMIDYSKIVPQRVATLKPSGIRKFFDVAATMEDVVSLMEKKCFSPSFLMV